MDTYLDSDDSQNLKPVSRSGPREMSRQSIHDSVINHYPAERAWRDLLGGAWC